jgi:hypothetical protein
MYLEAESKIDTSRLHLINSNKNKEIVNFIAPAVIENISKTTGELFIRFENTEMAYWTPPHSPYIREPHNYNNINYNNNNYYYNILKINLIKFYLNLPRSVRLLEPLKEKLPGNRRD